MPAAASSATAAITRALQLPALRVANGDAAKPRSISMSPCRKNSVITRDVHSLDSFHGFAGFDTSAAARGGERRRA